MPDPTARSDVSAHTAYDRRAGDRRGSGRPQAPPDAAPSDVAAGPSSLAALARDHWGKGLLTLALTVGGLQKTVGQKADQAEVQALRVEVQGVSAKLDILLCDRFRNPMNCSAEVAARIRMLSGSALPTDHTGTAP